MDVANLPARLAAREARGRAMALARMTSRANIWRTTGRTTQNEETGEEVPEWETIHADLPVRFPPARGGAANSRTLDIGGVEFTVGVREMHVAYDTTDLADGDLAEVTVGRAVGAVWRIVDASPPPDQATAYRLDVIAVDRPEEW